MEKIKFSNEVGQLNSIGDTGVQPQIKCVACTNKLDDIDHPIFAHALLFCELVVKFASFSYLQVCCSVKLSCGQKGMYFVTNAYAFPVRVESRFEKVSVINF